MTQRCFLAVVPDARIRTLLARAAADLRIEAPEWAGEKWVRPENLHVTMRFYGEIPERRLSLLATALSSAARRLPPFDLEFDRLEPSPSARRCRIVWARFRDAGGAFGRTCEAFDTASAAAGVIVPEPRPPLAHVTLCRARRPRSLSSQALERTTTNLSCGNPEMSVHSVTLCASRLTPEGPLYEALGTWRLGGNDRSEA